MQTANEIQSKYFNVAKVSLYVTILHRHAVEAFDGITSTETEPRLIKGLVFVISDDPVQDQDSVHKVQELIHDYLTNETGYNTQKMHEFTDGSAAQYKSHHCSLADSSYQIQRNYYKTSHAKGEQDAAGSHVKQKVSHAVLRRTATINSAKTMHQYLVANFSQPASSNFGARTNSVQLKCRKFFYVPSIGDEAVARNKPGRKFKAVDGVRKLHCIKSIPQQEKLIVRNRSCYCVSCIA